MKEAPLADGTARSRSVRYSSLKDVAALAQVSFQTASKVLNGSDVHVVPATAARIFAAAGELGYLPNVVARSLVQRSTSTIGLVIGNVTDASLARVAIGVQQEAAKSGHAILLGSVPSFDAHGAEVVRMLSERRVDGIIVAPPQLEDDFELAEMVQRWVPAVVLQHVSSGDVVPFVGSDELQAGRIATEHLLSLGHRSIGTVTGSFRRWTARSRLRGYREALAGAGLEARDDLVAEADWTPEGGAMAVRALVERQPRVTAMVVQNDEMAIGVLRELKYLGRHVPDDVAVVGCDDLLVGDYVTPRLTTVHVPFVEIGELAVRVLLECIEARASVAGEHLLPVSMVIRESCGSRPLVPPSEALRPRLP